MINVNKILGKMLPRGNMRMQPIKVDRYGKNLSVTGRLVDKSQKGTFDKDDYSKKTLNRLYQENKNYDVNEGLPYGQLEFYHKTGGRAALKSWYRSGQIPPQNLDIGYRGTTISTEDDLYPESTQEENIDNVYNVKKRSKIYKVKK